MTDDPPRPAAPGHDGTAPRAVSPDGERDPARRSAREIQRILSAGRRLADAAESALTPSGLSLPQFTVLQALARRQAATVAQVAAAAGLSPQAAGAVLLRLDRQDLVDRHELRDRRPEVTEAGRALYARAAEAMAALDAHVTSAYGDLAELADLVEEVVGDLTPALRRRQPPDADEQGRGPGRETTAGSARPGDAP